MRRPVVPLALVLAVATGLVLAELRLALAPRNDTAELTAGNVAAIRRFYDAVNVVLLTGNVDPLAAQLAPDFVEHTAVPGQTSDEDGLAGYLRALHRATPALVVMVDDLVAQGDRVAVRVQVNGADSGSATGLPPVAGRAWGTLDYFRLRAGQITEHWGDDFGLAVAEPLLEIGVHVGSPAAKWVESGRLTYSPGGADQRWTSGPTILLVETGRLTVTPDPISPESATLVPTGGARRAVASGEAVALGVGDALVLANGSFFETRNGGSLPATVLVLWAGEPGFPLRVSPAKSVLDATPVAPPPTASYTALAGGMGVRFPEEQATLTIGRVAMAAGVAVARHQVAQAEFVIVETGRLALTIEGGRAWLRSGTSDPTRPVTGETAATGTGLAFDAGATVGFTGDGDGPLVALVIVVGPERNGGRPIS
jgi:predicted ester cyclase